MIDTSTATATSRPAKRELLLGTHQPAMEMIMKRWCARFNYNSISANTVEGFLNCMEQKHYDRYMIEANLGQPNGADLNPARLAHSLLVSQVGIDNANRRFLAMSGEGNYVKRLVSEGIPAKYKPFPGSEIEAFLK